MVRNREVDGLDVRTVSVKDSSRNKYKSSFRKDVTMNFLNLPESPYGPDPVCKEVSSMFASFADVVDRLLHFPKSAQNDSPASANEESLLEHSSTSTLVEVVAGY